VVINTPSTNSSIGFVRNRDSLSIGLVVLRYRTHLEFRNLASGTINVRLAAVRRLAYEAADAGLLSPELAAGIRRVKGAKKLGIRLGNWLSASEARALWQSHDAETLKGKRDRGIIAVLLGCGLRRRELADLTFDHLQRREDHWAIVDLVGKGGPVRTVPVPTCVKRFLDEWFAAEEIEAIRDSPSQPGLVPVCRCLGRNSTAVENPAEVGSAQAPVNFDVLHLVAVRVQTDGRDAGSVAPV
jgi:integrase